MGYTIYWNELLLRKLQKDLLETLLIRIQRHLKWSPLEDRLLL